MTPGITIVPGDVPATDSGTARPPRAKRRSPAEIPFSFATEALVARLVAERAEPDWLRDERLAAATSFAALPTETNQLYTPYVDLRGAVLDDARPYIETASRPDAGAAALILRSLMRSIVDGADARIVSEIVDRLQPSDMFRVEYMMILEAVQALRKREATLSLKAIKDELLPQDPAGFALITLESVVEKRDEGPDDPSAIADLVDLLITFRSGTV